MKYGWIGILACVMIFTACASDEIKPKQITENNINTEEAEAILHDTYEPIHRMTNSDFKTIPDVKVKSYKEFADTFDLSLMDERVIKNYIFETLVYFDDEGNPVKDADGFLKYKEAGLSPYIPTIFEKGVVIKNAFIRDIEYGAEFSCMNTHELVVEEIADENIGEVLQGFTELIDSERIRKVNGYCMM